MSDRVYSVRIFSPGGQAADVLPIEVPLETAQAVAKIFHSVTHLSFQIVNRPRWAAVEEEP